MITIVDYGRGNLYGLARAFEACGTPTQTTGRAETVRGAEALVLPGVGAFGDAMAALARDGLDRAVRDAASAGVPLLGICLGMQLLFDDSEEFGSSRGLGLIPGTVRRLPEGTGADATRIPNVGWRALARRRPDPLLDGNAENSMFYFVHSYAALPARREHTVATLRLNGVEPAVVVRRGNLAGVQFHPEKSGAGGLRLLARFADMALRRAA